MDRPPRSDRPDGLGIDLDRYYLDIRRVTLGKHGRRIRRAGLDPDEVISEVCRRILTAEARGNPYDPARASMGKYIFVQGLSAIRNLLAASRTFHRYHAFGAVDADGVEQDVAALDLPDDLDDLDDIRAAASDIAISKAETMALYLMASGASDAEVVKQTGECPSDIRAWLEAEYLTDPDEPDVFTLFGEERP